MIEKLDSYKGVAIVQFSEQINIFKDYFLKIKIVENEILWVPITDSAL